MPLGNDVIDRVEGAKHRPQYYQRQQRSSFHPQELDLLSGFEEAFWLLWAIKESAFKAVAQAGRVEKRFNPKDFELSEIQDSGGLISYAIVCEDFLFQGEAEITTDFIHAISWTVTKPIFESGVIEGDFKDYHQQSEALKKDALQAFASHIEKDSGGLFIQKDHNQIPFFQSGDQRFGNDLSLSHHGRFIAYAFTL